MKTIDTLIEDLEDTLCNGAQIPEELVERYKEKFGEFLKYRFTPESKVKRGTLRFSNLGRPCERQLWYEVNSPEEGEPLRPETYMKFLIGDLIELLTLFLVEASGHTVEGTQDTQVIEGVVGHRDGVIDGVLVDVKSASSRSFHKFKEGKLSEDDPFGYVDQLQAYLYAGQDDPIVTDKDRAAFLVVDKTLGHICLDVHERSEVPYDSIVRHKKEVVNSDELPERAFEDVPDGKSGNRKLATTCSYCAFKNSCWPDLKTYIYSNGPRYFTHVEKEPKVEQV